MHRLQDGTIGKRPALRSLLVSAAVCVLVAISQRPAAANGITFAQGVDSYFNVGTGGVGQDWNLTTSGSGCNAPPAGPCTSVLSVTSSGSPPNAVFVFDTATVLGSPLQFIPAVFSFSATSTTVGNCGVSCSAGPPPDTYTQTGYNGTFQYTVLSGPYAGQILLKGTFTNAAFTSSINQNTGSVGYTGQIAVNPGNLTFSSAFLNFTNQTEEDATWTFSSFQTGSGGGFNVGTVSGADQAFPEVGTFTGTGTGTFATQPGFAPEPGSMTLMTAGVGLMVYLRRRRAGGSTW